MTMTTLCNKRRENVKTMRQRAGWGTNPAQREGEVKWMKVVTGKSSTGQPQTYLKWHETNKIKSDFGDDIVMKVSGASQL